MKDIDTIIDWYIAKCQKVNTIGMTIGDYTECYINYAATNQLRLPDGVDDTCRMLFLGLRSRMRFGYHDVKLTNEQSHRLDSSLASWFVDLFKKAIELSTPYRKTA